jgi:hypothetical protein
VRLLTLLVPILTSQITFIRKCSSQCSCDRHMYWAFFMLPLLSYLKFKINALLDLLVMKTLPEIDK